LEVVENKGLLKDCFSEYRVDLAGQEEGLSFPFNIVYSLLYIYVIVKENLQLTENAGDRFRGVAARSLATVIGLLTETMDASRLAGWKYT
jgi:hypothetical protein